MGSGRTVNPAGQARRRQAHGDHARGGEWPDVHSVDWLSVAGNPKGFAAALDLVRLLRSVELGWHARSHPSRTLCEVPRGGRQRSEPHRRSDRQPEREKRRKRSYGAGGEKIASIGAATNRWSTPMQQPNDLSRSLATFEPDSTLIAVIEMGKSSWLVAGLMPGIDRQPLKKLAVDEVALLKLLNRWRTETEQTGRKIKRIAVAFEAGRDGFWLARWLRARGIEAHVIHPSSVAVPREHRRAQTGRLPPPTPQR